MHPQLTAEDRMTHTIHFLSGALKDIPTSIGDSQLAAIEAVRAIFENWKTVESLPPEAKIVLPHPTPVIPRQAAAPVWYSPPASKVGQEKKDGHKFQGCSTTKVTHYSKKNQVAINSKCEKEPIAKHTQSSIYSASPPIMQTITQHMPEIGHVLC